MKHFALLSLVLLITLSSCSTVRVAADFDQQVNFENYKSYAFFKPGIDKADISDIDKRRILRGIDGVLNSKGLSKSDNPDLLVSIFTKTRQNINVYQNNWGWNPWLWGPNYNNVSRVTEGTLYIDLIDAKKRELIWQGSGTSPLPRNIERKEQRIQEIVQAVLEKFPPQQR